MIRPPTLRRSLLVAALFLGLSGAAQAQTFVNPLCRSYVSSADLRFDSAEHTRWYRRFWTGDCDRLFACFPGAPNWNEIAAQLIARGGGGERAALQPKVCALGQRIGLEWSREHAVRRISTADLHRYSDMLRSSGDALRGVEAVARAVDADLRRPPSR